MKWENMEEFPLEIPTEFWSEKWENMEEFPLEIPTEFWSGKFKTWNNIGDPDVDGR